METENSFRGKIPHIPLESEIFKNFFFQRAERVENEMSDMYYRVSNASRESLRVDHYPGGEDFKVFICPVKVIREKEMDHPLLLTYCVWSKGKTMLYWPMDMIPLTNEERHSIWYDFVKDDEFYYGAGY